MVIVNKLVRFGGDAHVALKWTVEGDDHEKHHGEESGQADKKNALKDGSLHMEKRAQQDAAHRARKQHEPQHTGKPCLHGIQPLSSLLHQLIIGAQRFGMTFDFLKKTVRKNRMTGMAAIKIAISLSMRLASRPGGAADRRH